MLPTKEQMDDITVRHMKAERYFKNRALMVIETLCGDDIVTEDIKKLKSDIYKIAHVATGTCPNEHPAWRKEVNEMYKEFKKHGI